MVTLLGTVMGCLPMRLNLACTASAMRAWRGAPVLKAIAWPLKLVAVRDMLPGCCWGRAGLCGRCAARPIRAAAQHWCALPRLDA